MQRVRREGGQALLLRRTGVPQLQGLLQEIGPEQVSLTMINILILFLRKIYHFLYFNCLKTDTRNEVGLGCVKTHPKARGS